MRQDVDETKTTPLVRDADRSLIAAAFALATLVEAAPTEGAHLQVGWQWLAATTVAAAGAAASRTRSWTDRRMRASTVLVPSMTEMPEKAIRRAVSAALWPKASIMK